MARKNQRVSKDFVPIAQHQQIKQAEIDKKNNFLKRRANLKYDPRRAIEEDKLKRKLIETQSQITDNMVESKCGFCSSHCRLCE